VRGGQEGGKGEFESRKSVVFCGRLIKHSHKKRCQAALCGMEARLVH
jgi:hypothetical protein